MRNGKPETRNQKSVFDPEAQTRRESMTNEQTRNDARFVIRVSDLIRISGFGFLICLLAACTGNAQSRQSLDAANQSLNASQYDQAIRDTDSVLSSSDSAAYAEAWYIRGYAIEKRPKPDNPAAQRDLSLAADSYNRGLASNPRPRLRPGCMRSLGTWRITSRITPRPFAR